MGCHPSHWRTPSFFRRVGWNHQPDVRTVIPQGSSRRGTNGWARHEFKSPTGLHNTSVFIRAEPSTPLWKESVWSETHKNLPKLVVVLPALKSIETYRNLWGLWGWPAFRRHTAAQPLANWLRFDRLKDESSSMLGVERLGKNPSGAVVKNKEQRVIEG